MNIYSVKLAHLCRWKMQTTAAMSVIKKELNFCIRKLLHPLYLKVVHVANENAVMYTIFHNQSHKS